jgi:tRNA pseudouridine32 synthase/23S rRNA pseudouridine746 synthase
MASRFVVPKTLSQKVLNKIQRFSLPLASTTCAERVVPITFVGNNTLLFTTILKRDTMANHFSNKCDGAVDFSIQTTTTSTTTNGEAEKGRSLDKGDDLELTSNLPGNKFPRTPYDDEDKYCVEIEDGFMKISMSPVSIPGGKGGETISSSSTLKTAENNKTNVSNEQKNKDRESPAKIPDTVLQFQRQKRKNQAAKRASTPLPRSQLQIVYDDEHMVVVNKPSGVLTVPGINSNPSMLSLLHEIYKEELDPEMKKEHMIVHRLDMDTSGIVMYAKSKKVLLKLQALFRERDEVSKYYEAVVCGHLHPEVERGSIDLPLQRDHRFPPFMRVATPSSEREAQEVVKDLQNAGWKKIVKKKAKPSQTLFEVIGREYRYCDGDDSADEIGCQENKKRKKGDRYPVTRLRLTLKTGRTHQLRVHLSSIGHPILGDPAYGIYGEASSNGGFEDDLMDELVPKRAPMDLQLALDRYVKDKGQVMCLHARELRVQHPETGKPLIFEKPPAF